MKSRPKLVVNNEPPMIETPYGPLPACLFEPLKPSQWQTHRKIKGIRMNYLSAPGVHAGF